MDLVLQQIVAPLLTVVAGLVVTYGAAIARRYANLAIAKLDDDLDEAARKRLTTAFENAIAKAENAGGAIDWNVAVDYVKRFNPGDVARMGLDAAKLKERLLATSKRDKHDENMLKDIQTRMERIQRGLPSKNLAS